jgi:membrane-bound serine protease (ClpP class)
MREAASSCEHLMGRHGIATTRLGPAGKAQFDSEVYDVISDGDLIPRGTPIQVIEVIGNRVVVQAIEAE